MRRARETHGGYTTDGLRTEGNDHIDAYMDALWSEVTDLIPLEEGEVARPAREEPWCQGAKTMDSVVRSLVSDVQSACLRGRDMDSPKFTIANNELAGNYHGLATYVP